MSTLVSSKRFRRSVVWIGGIAVAASGGWQLLAQSEADSSGIVLARGGGTTIIEGGTGKSGDSVPVLTTVAFHVERQGRTITGDFECLARSPEKTAGAASAQFTVSAMYVTGQINTVSINRDTATLTGTADITGL
jgi:hypothetical protein